MKTHFVTVEVEVFDMRDHESAIPPATEDFLVDRALDELLNLRVVVGPFVVSARGASVPGASA